MVSLEPIGSSLPIGKSSTQLNHLVQLEHSNGNTHFQLGQATSREICMHKLINEFKWSSALTSFTCNLYKHLFIYTIVVQITIDWIIFNGVKKDMHFAAAILLFCEKAFFFSFSALVKHSLSAMIRVQWTLRCCDEHYSAGIFVDNKFSHISVALVMYLFLFNGFQYKCTIIT